MLCKARRAPRSLLLPAGDRFGTAAPGAQPQMPAFFLSMNSALSRLHLPRNGRVPSLHGQACHRPLAPACLPLSLRWVLPASLSSQGRASLGLEGRVSTGRTPFIRNMCNSSSPSRVLRLSSEMSGSPGLVWPCLHRLHSPAAFIVLCPWHFC